jgi:hypothetical protein
MKLIRNVAVCLAILGVGLPAAADVKAIHGAVCQPSGPFFDLSNVDHSAVFGAIAQTDNVDVACPLVRDRINSSTSLSSAAVEFFNSTASTTNPSCLLFAQVEDTSGSYIDFESASTTTTGFTQLNFTGLTTTNGNEGSYGLQCTMGLSDQLYHINLNENNAATD